MQKIAKIILYVWSAIMILAGLISWISTMGRVQGSEFGMQIDIANSLGMILIWLALFGVWFSLTADNYREKKPNGIEDKTAEWKCPKCGASNPNVSFTCKNCGYTLR